MKKSVVIAFLFIVTVPLMVAGWLGWRSVTTEQSRFQERVLELQKDRLREFSNNQERWIGALQTSLLKYLESVRNEPLSDWPRLQNQNRYCTQLFAVDPTGKLTWPNADVLPLAKKEIEFRDLFELGKINLTATNLETRKRSSPFHWSTWFEGPGQQWAFWMETGDGRKIGMVVDRTALISEAIAQLPDESPVGSYGSNPEGFVLLNEAGETLYTWGAIPDPTNSASPIETDLPTPLSMWRLQLITPTIDTPPWHRQPLVLAMTASIIGLSLITLISAYYLYTETRREFLEARRKVSFVNQVSHEFKTPLTNIQLYSELLEESVDGEAGQKYLKIIQEETHKLSRMIINVLTFARNQKASIQVKPKSLVPDHFLEEQLAMHQPGMERQRITLEKDLDAGRPMNLDPEIVSQIFGNLLSNAEKYAPGSTVSITSRQTENQLVVIVRDTGPGIAVSKQNSVFEPFVRLENRTTEGVSGTGIGLSIARDLARLHGGELGLSSSGGGAAFTFTLKDLA